MKASAPPAGAFLIVPFSHCLGVSREAPRSGEHRARVREAFERYALEDPDVGDGEVDFLLRQAAPWLEREAESSSFLDIPVEQHIANLRRALNHSGAAEDEDEHKAPAPPPREIDRTADLPWRSSA